MYLNECQPLNHLRMAATRFADYTAPDKKSNSSYIIFFIFNKNPII